MKPEPREQREQPSIEAFLTALSYELKVEVKIVRWEEWAIVRPNTSMRGRAWNELKIGAAGQRYGSVDLGPQREVVAVRLDSDLGWAYAKPVLDVCERLGVVVE